VVLAINQRDLDRQSGQRFSSLQTAKAASHDDHTRTGFVVHGHYIMGCSGKHSGDNFRHTPAGGSTEALSKVGVSRF
jgi:hypothetical protein